MSLSLEKQQDFLLARWECCQGMLSCLGHSFRQSCDSQREGFHLLPFPSPQECTSWSKELPV